MADEQLERITILLQARDREFARAMDRNNKLIARMTRDADRQTATMSRQVDRHLRAAGASVVSFGKAFAVGLAGGAIGAVLAGVTTNIRGVIGEMSQLAKSADRIGVATDALQGLQRGFSLAGVDAAKASQALQMFAQRAGDAAEGRGELLRVLTASGIALRGENGEMRGTLDLLRDFADRMAAARSQSERLSMANAAFGEQGRGLVNALQNGGAALDEMIRAAREGGYVIEDSVLRKAEALDDRFDDLTRKVGVFFKTLIVNSADAAVELVDLRAKLDELFRDEDQARAILGDSYDALAGDRDALDAVAGDVALLRQEYERLADQAQALAPALESAAVQLRALGYGDQAEVLADTAREVRDLAAGLREGTIEAGEFEARLADTTTAAAIAMTEIETIDRVDFSNVISGIGAIATKLGEAIGRARALRAALPGTAPGASEADRAALRDRMMGFEPIDPDAGTLLAPGSSPRPRGAPTDPDFGYLPPAAGGGGGGGGGGGRDDWRAAVERIRERTAALEAEAAVLVTAAASGTEYGDALEYARRRAELMLAAQRSGRAITPELTAEIDALAAAYAEAGMQAEQAADRLRSMQDHARRGADAVTDIFTSVLTGARSAGDAVAALLMEIAKVQLRSAFMQMAGGGGFFGFLGGLLTGARAQGGGVRAGGAYLVNENTPNSEIFVPSRNGAVLNVPQAQAALRDGAGGMVDVRVAVDDDGRLTATIARVSGNVVARAAPGIVQSAVGAVAEIQRETRALR